jgi:hypothetical protein
MNAEQQTMRTSPAIILFCLFCLGMPTSNNLYAQQGSALSAEPCACAKYQRLAEKRYKKIIRESSDFKKDNHRGLLRRRYFPNFSKSRKRSSRAFFRKATIGKLDRCFRL